MEPVSKFKLLHSNGIGMPIEGIPEYKAIELAVKMAKEDPGLTLWKITGADGGQQIWPSSHNLGRSI